MSKSPAQEVLDVVDAAIQPTAANNDPFTFNTSTGVVLKLRKVSQILIRDMGKRIPEPKVPIVHIQEDDRDDENPSDPRYIAAMQQYREKVGDLSMSLYLSMGTKLVSYPDDMLGPEEDWDNPIALVLAESGLDFPKATTPSGRYMLWLKFVAIPDVNELLDLMTRIATLSGVTFEREVAKQIESFRSVPEGDTDTELPAS